MKKTICMITFCALASAALWAQDRPKLSFRADGKFKIAQFTDLHWTHGAVTCARTTATIKAVLEAEKPDVAILTGDVVWRTPDREPWTDIPKIFEDARTPFAVVFGNHDAEGGTKITRAEIMDILLRSPWFIGEKGPDDIHGVGNYILPVYGSKSNRPAALLYCFDSNAYDPKYGPNAPVYFDQIAWYRRQSDAITAGNDGTPLPALAFFHIPLPEYNNLIGQRNTLGTNGEKPCPPNFNTGLFSAFIDREDVMGAFVGHDHNNDYIGLEGHIAPPD